MILNTRHGLPVDGPSRKDTSPIGGLFFTRRQVILICNRNIYWEVTKDLSLFPKCLGSLSDCVRYGTYQKSSSPWVRPPNSLTKAKSLLHAYSRRKLSYDEDALDAVVGALNMPTLEAKELFQYWGMPMNSSDTRAGQVGLVFLIGLNWYHQKPCRRRIGFPSWSLLRWDGPIEWGNERVQNQDMGK